MAEANWKKIGKKIQRLEELYQDARRCKFNGPPILRSGWVLDEIRQIYPGAEVELGQPLLNHVTYNGTIILLPPPYSKIEWYWDKDTLEHIDRYLGMVSGEKLDYNTIDEFMKTGKLPWSTAFDMDNGFWREDGFDDYIKWFENLNCQKSNSYIYPATNHWMNFGNKIGHLNYLYEQVRSMCLGMEMYIPGLKQHSYQDVVKHIGIFLLVTSGQHISNIDEYQNSGDLWLIGHINDDIDVTEYGNIFMNDILDPYIAWLEQVLHRCRNTQIAVTKTQQTFLKKKYAPGGKYYSKLETQFYNKLK